MLGFGRGVKIGGVAPSLFLSQKAEEKTGMGAGWGVGKRLTEKSKKNAVRIVYPDMLRLVILRFLY